MPRIRTQIREIMREMDGRSARVRPGSVLILVVVLLVLMALLGTAFLITSRNDRVATRLYSHNVQIDMLLDGVEHMAIASLSQTNSSTSNLQRYDDWFTTGTTPMPNGTAVDHSWLGSRYPVTLTDALGSFTGGPAYPVPKGAVVLTGAGIFESTIDNNTNTPPGTGWVTIGFTSGISNSSPFWPALSGPLVANSFNEDPRYPTIPAGATVSPRPDGVRTYASPTFVTLNGTNYPALSYYSTVNSKAEICLAASASGNGIADAFLWRLPIGTIDGITYYAAVRIIDNGSAINVNTANSSTTDFDAGGNPTIATDPWAQAFLPVFTSGVGLAERTNTSSKTVASDTTISTELAALNKIRFGNQQRPQGIYNAAGTAAPLNDNGTTRTDFNYLSEGDALYNILGRRVNNPGLTALNAPLPPSQAQALSWGDAMALANHFDLRIGNASPTPTETALINSTWNTPGIPNGGSGSAFRSTPWDPSSVNTWFAQYNETAGGPINCRPYFTTHNALSNLMPARNLLATAGINAGMAGVIQTYMYGPAGTSLQNDVKNQTLPRVSLNTADITAQDVYLVNPRVAPESPPLWLGFYMAMLDALTLNPAIVTNAQGAYQFRTPIRDLNGAGATTYLTGPETMLLRSLEASVNCKDLRDSGDNATAYAPPGIQNFPATIAGNPNASVSVYPFGTERQVFITEVYASNEQVAPATLGSAATSRPNPDRDKRNPKGYVAVELYNPYDYPVDITNWTLGVAARSNGAPQSLKVFPISNFPGFSGAAARIPPKGYLVLENYNGGGAGAANDATYRPQANFPGYVAAPATYYVPNLHEVMQDPDNAATQPGGELILLRPTFASGPLGPNVAGLIAQTPIPLALLELLPAADSVDFSGLTEIAQGKTTVTEIHYVRANPGNAQPTKTTAWKFVYPGRWDAGRFAPYRQEGIEVSTWDPNPANPGNNFDPWADTVTPSFGGNPTPIALGAADKWPSYTNNFGAIQLNNTDMGGPNKLLVNSQTPQQPYRFPYGGFARLGDVLQTPFFGSYLLVNPNGDATLGTAVVEINSVTRDCALADDNDGGGDDTIEQVGRFCPLLATEITGVENLPIGGGGVTDYYGWASHIFDYFTAIQNPHDDYLPNIEPNVYSLGPWDMRSLTYSQTGAFGGVALPVANTAKSPNGANNGYEDTVPIEGLMNLNTANWRALAAIPWLPTNTAANIANNRLIAQNIVTFRNTYGPFKTLFDLNKVPAYAALTPGIPSFQTYMGDPVNSYFGPNQGNISPLNAVPSGATSDGVTGDFENRFAMMNRVSNIVTTRSDTYTVYVLVQGWSGVGTANPQLVVQRRGALIVDRSQLTSVNSTVGVYKMVSY